MSCKVIWSPQALDQLTESSSKASDRDAVSAASWAIDKILEENPTVAGESRDGPLRILFEPPMRVDFEVDENSSIIYDCHVGLMRKN